ncbi:PREDICTED: uncharacterized protein LOC105556039 [Vollenhovia emeryi]|uniref:uncharacterized protein LOC105556039 n=1 Tax=Vollenhovia emeryi TaxID=411798 RepID=UPI0005F38B38|nr:PREDICTED: uncharacterized protein LOC105556039 [Vollenhovia emeryi]
MEVPSDVSQLLRRWGVSEAVIKRFQENRIRVEHLTKMTEFTLEKLIPIAGERLDLMDHLQAFQENYTQTQFISIPFTVPVIENENADNEMSFDTDTDTRKTNISIISVKSDIASDQSEFSMSSLTQGELSNPKPSTSQETVETYRETYKSPTNQLYEKNDKYDLLALLQSSTSGKMVLAYFREHACLNSCIRKILANEIINNELSVNVSAGLPNERVEFLAKQIIKYFPSELEVIWRGTYVRGGKRHRESSIGRGILLQRYYNIRRKLRKCGVLRKEVLTYTTEDSATSEVELDDDITSDNIQWLKNNSKPWTKVQELWRLTNRGRIRLLQKEAIAVHVYMDMFPALKHVNGYLLLEQDFEEVYPNSGMKLYAEWPTLATFIERKVSKTERDNINNSLTPEGKKVRTLLAINSLFTVVTTLKRKKISWRPSRQESREAFLLFVKTTNDIEPTLKLRREKYAKYGLTLGVQAVIVGAQLDYIKHSYIIINDICYEVETALKAIDIAFKSTYALDTNYPSECAREWLFLQRCIYEISTPSDKDICNLTVLGLIEEYLKIKADS